MERKTLIVLAVTVLATGCVIRTQTTNAKPTQRPRTGAKNLSALASIADRGPTGPGAVELDREMRASFNLSALGRKAVARSNYAAAERYFRQALALYPRSDEAKTGLAQTLDREGRLDEASTAYGSAYTGSDALSVYSTFPSDIAALARHGLVSEEAGKHQEAVKSYDMARQWFNTKLPVPLTDEFDPKGMPSPRLKAMLRTIQGVALMDSKSQDGQDRSGEALEAFQEAAQQEPNDARVQYYLGYGFQKAGQFAAARAAYGRASRLDTAGAVKAAAVEGARAAQARRR